MMLNLAAEPLIPQDERHADNAAPHLKRRYQKAVQHAQELY